MNYKIFVLILLVCLSGKPVYSIETIRHIVVNGKVTDEKGKGISGVKITDGRIFAVTDDAGNYSIETLSNCDYVYYTNPSGYIINRNGVLPDFYKKIDKNKTLQTVNFILTKDPKEQKEHNFIVWGDPQVYMKEEFSQLKEVVDDVKKTVKESSKHFHAISVGDNVFDKHELIEDYVKTISDLDIPFYHVIGNHDMDYNNRSNELSDKTYSKSFGPSHYSFDFGDIHYVVLNNVFYYGFTYRYIGYITEEQLSWLEQDLSFVPKGKTVIVSLHIPTMFDKSRKPRDYSNLLSSSVMNNKALYSIFNGYNVHIMAGHSHVQWNTLISDNIFEHVHAAASGAWWQGDICTDGCPKGYTVYEVDGDNLTWYFKGLDLSKEEQFKYYLKGNELLVNVFNYDDNWKIECFENNVKVDSISQIVDVDPIAKQIYKPGKNKVHRWLAYKKTGHLFKIKIQDPNSEIKIVVTDRFGNTYKKTISPYKMVWNDEFDKKGFPDKRKWNYDIQGNSTGWGNNEAQYYTEKDKDNVQISDGTLKIIARKEKKEGKEYTSARLTTKGKGDWKYCKIEVRAKVPQGKGTWSAIWMLPTKNEYGGWPKSGEIDIMEHVGYANDSIYSTAHTEGYNHIKGNQKTVAYVDDSFTSDFHIYTLEWNELGWSTYVDGNYVYTWENDFQGYASWPFDKEFHLILNLAIGGNWGGKHGIDNTTFPKVFEIDYVRVYQRK